MTASSSCWTSCARSADPRSCGLAEELLRLVSELYGAGIGRVVALAEERAPDLLDAFVEDDLVASLLLVLGLHPKPLETRVADALQEVRPFLASHAGGVELLGVDAEAGVVHLRLLGSCDGCPSSAVTLQMAVERAIVEAAPEIIRIDVDAPFGYRAWCAGGAERQAQVHGMPR